MSPIVPSRYGHPKYNIFPQKSRSAAAGSLKSTQRGTPGVDSKSRRKQRVEDSKISVQPNEDEDADNFFSKHLAAARFQRNHRLINVLFNDSLVELEPPADNDKVNACRKRTKSLMEFQQKIEEEIAEMNSLFNTRKTEILEESKCFADKLSEFMAKSKKEIEECRAAQEVLRQQEAARRQQESLNRHNEVMANGQEARSEMSDISQVLNEIVSSIADRV